ncbi:TenA family protein [Nesterenkonia flava]|uniref:Aminopyrimidine aminohydrolase n=1 Tax=Nesterenkonia flava TaxID=469799 RepID=A0ABU1FVJ4_9MICC|nr:TenA family protein [Nesterenkonia flava]MDR5712694.1 TenA family protein [Nesterenkonia flava]
MSQRFTDQLRAENQPAWDNAVGHRFVRELLSGTVSDHTMAAYLVQDHRFLDSFLTLLGSAIATADTFEARLRFGRFAGMISSEENTYFLRAFEALGVSEDQRAGVPDTEPTAGFQAIMREAAATRNYVAVLAVLTVAEWLYYEWARTLEGELPTNFVHAEWITLHDNPEFVEFVGFLRSELDRLGPEDDAVARDFFGRATALELEFFEAVYAGGDQ